MLLPICDINGNILKTKLRKQTFKFVHNNLLFLQKIQWPARRLLQSIILPELQDGQWRGMPPSILLAVVAVQAIIIIIPTLPILRPIGGDGAVEAELL